MEISRNKTMASTIALFLVLTIAFTLAALPVAKAHIPPWTIPTHSYIAVAPNPVGVTQSVYVIMWVHPNPPTASGEGGDRWRNITLTITKPNNDIDTFGPWNSDPTGSLWTQYTPDQTGTYKFEMDYPGQVLSWYGPTGLPPGDPSYLVRTEQLQFLNDTFTGSSATTYLTVQQEPVEKIPDYPLPTGYWTRPIEGRNTAWASVASNWLGSSHIVGNYQPDGIAPESPHIMWTMPTQFGGVVGGTYAIPGVGFYSGGSYEGRFGSPIIMYGRLYFQLPLSHSGGGGDYVCIELSTGKELWRRDDINPRFGQLYDYESRNQHGVVQGVLWQAVGSKWIGYDAFTGKWVYNFTGVPSGFEVYTDYGEINRYVLNYGERWMALWSTAATNGSNLVAVPGFSTSAYQFRPLGKEVDMSGPNQYLWNVSIPDLPGDATPSIFYIIPGDLIFGTSSAWPNFRQIGTPDPYTLWAISDRDDGTRGQLLWITNYTAPAGYLTLRIAPFGGICSQVDPVNRMFMLSCDETFQWTGYSLDNGTLQWGPVGENFHAFQYYGQPMVRAQTCYCAYGNMYVGSYGGEVHCYDTATGNLEWEYNQTYAGYENIWGNYPTFIGTIADGKVYTYNHEHSPNYPLYKGNSIRCINAYTGDEIWKMVGWAEKTIVAEGFLVYFNYYDNQIYCIGQGPTAATVSASPKVVANGDSVLIEGRVTDQSPRAAAYYWEDAPAIADENMGVWMEYLYMQKPCPMDIKGVDVMLQAISSSGTTTDLGWVTSDGYGCFSYMWTPPDEDTYTIMTVFPGTKSYWPSYAQTGLGVTAAPPEPTEPAVQKDVDQAIDSLNPLFYAIIAAVAIAIVIGIVNLWAIRKR